MIRKKKPQECGHIWEFIEKWQKGKNLYYEFYCKICTEVITRKVTAA